MNEPTRITAHPAVVSPGSTTPPVAPSDPGVEAIVTRLDRLEQAIEELNRTTAALPDKLNKQRVYVIDFNMPFIALVGFMVKVAIASIPAAIITAIVLAVLWTMLGGAILSALSAMFG